MSMGLSRKRKKENAYNHFLQKRGDIRLWSIVMYRITELNVKMDYKGRMYQYAERIELLQCSVQCRACVSQVILYRGSRRGEESLIFLGEGKYIQIYCLGMNSNIRLRDTVMWGGGRRNMA
jgi:hypothetical protein